MGVLQLPCLWSPEQQPPQFVASAGCRLSLQGRYQVGLPHGPQQCHHAWHRLLNWVLPQTQPHGRRLRHGCLCSGSKALSSYHAGMLLLRGQGIYLGTMQSCCACTLLLLGKAGHTPWHQNTFLALKSNTHTHIHIHHTNQGSHYLASYHNAARLL